MNEVPTLAQEIERKAFETIEKLHSDYFEGRINEAQAAYGRDVLWSAVAGLAGKDFVIAMELFDSEVPKPVSKTYMVKGDAGNTSIMCLTNHHDGTLTLKGYRNTSEGTSTKESKYDFREEPQPLERAKEERIKICAGLIKRGFTHL